MSVQNLITIAASGVYSNKINQQMDKIDYRRIVSSEDLSDVADLRRKSYLSAKIYSDENRAMIDDLDFDPKVFVFGVYFRDRIVSTVRIHILDADNRLSNSQFYFPNILNPLIDQGLSFMDPTRFAIDPSVEEQVVGLPLITLRLGFLAAKHFDCDYCLSMIKEGHGAFYRRVFQSSQITPFTQFSAFTSKYALFSSPKSMEELICARYPVFRSLAKERELLFASPKLGQPSTLSVRPTARISTELHQQMRRMTAQS